MDEYVSATELAKMFGLSVRRVQQLTQDGVLPATEKEHGRKYPVVDAVRAYIASEQKKFEAESGKARLGALKEEKLAAEVELKQSQGELHQLRTQIAQGKYISVEEAQLEYQKFFVIFKKFAMAIAPRVGGLICTHVDPVTARAIEKNVSSEVNDMLRNFVFKAGNSEAPAPEDSEPESPKKKTPAKKPDSKKKKAPARSKTAKSGTAAAKSGAKSGKSGTAASDKAPVQVKSGTVETAPAPSSAAKSNGKTAAAKGDKSERKPDALQPNAKKPAAKKKSSARSSPVKKQTSTAKSTAEKKAPAKKKTTVKKTPAKKPTGKV